MCQGCKTDQPEHAKIWNSLGKMRDPKLEHMHSNTIQRAKDPNCTHLEAVANSKEEIVRKNPNAHDTNKNTRRVKQTTAKRQQNCKHHNSNWGKNHGDTQQFKPGTITSKNGKKIKHHHSHQFDNEDFRFFTCEQKKTLRNERWAANCNEGANCNQG